jgi:hypothetical protein
VEITGAVCDCTFGQPARTGFRFRDKTRIYARASIPVYWIVNLVDRRIEVYSQPSGPTDQPAYGSFQIYQPGDNVPIILDGNTVGSVAVSELIL